MAMKPSDCRTCMGKGVVPVTVIECGKAVEKLQPCPSCNGQKKGGYLTK